MRVTDSMSMLTNHLQRLQETIFTRTREISSGKRLHEPSQDPAAASRVTRLRQLLSRTNQYNRNIQKAQVMLGSSDQALNTVRNYLDVAVERASMGINATSNQDNRNVIAAEIDEIRDSIFRIANSGVDGKKIFGGTETTTDPIQIVGGIYTYQGNSQPLTIEVAKGRTIQMTVTGDEVFTESTTDLLNTLGQMADDLRAGDNTATRAGMDLITQTGRVVDLARVKISESLRLADASQHEHGRQILNITTEMSTLEDANLAESITGLTRAETALQATLQTGARRRSSLFDLIG